MHLSELEANLHEARKRWKETIARDAPLEERLAADQAVLQAERALSLAQGEETALACEWEAPWETGAPLPHVVSSGMRTFLLYLANEPDPDWGGSYVTEMRTMDIHRIVLLEFVGSYTFQFGGPNDEVIGEHRLWGRGLAPTQPMCLLIPVGWQRWNKSIRFIHATTQTRGKRSSITCCSSHAMRNELLSRNEGE